MASKMPSERRKQRISRMIQSGLNQSDIGRELGVTRERARQLIGEYGLLDMYRVKQEYHNAIRLTQSAERAVAKWEAEHPGHVEAVSELRRLGHRVKQHIERTPKRCRVWYTVEPSGLELRVHRVRQVNGSQLYHLGFTTGDAVRYVVAPDFRAVFFPEDVPESGYAYLRADGKPKSRGLNPRHLWAV